MFTVGFELEFTYPSRRGCPECWGEGDIVCPSCDSRGEIDCPSCDGHGEVECPVCGGLGENECPDCSGAGCTKCDHTGYIPCESCDGGYDECPCCEGNGHVECPDCSGDGRIECPDCQGSGYEYNTSLEVLKRMEDLGAELTYDCSVYLREAGDAGRELRSPVFAFHDERSSWEYFVEDITSLIEEGGGDSSPDLMCGLHIHVRPYEGWTDELQERMYAAWFNWAEEMFIEKFSPASHRMCEYCQSWQDWAEYDLNEDEFTWAQEGKVAPYHDRYMTLNVRSLTGHGTLEFRLFNGTLDPGEIKETLTWVGTLTEAVLLCDDPNTIKEHFKGQLGLHYQAA